MTTAQLKRYLGCVVEVCWLDAHSTDPWTAIEDLGPMEGLPCRNYGVVVAANTSGIMVSTAINGATAVGGSWFIPRGMIEQMTILIDRKGLTNL